MSRGDLHLVQAPYCLDYGPMRKASGTYFPMGLGYIAAYVERAGFGAALIDPNAEEMSVDEAARRATEGAPVCVGVSFMTPQLHWARDFARALRRIAPKVPLVLGGAHPSVLPEQTLADIPEADYVVYGEGEETTLELLEYLAEGKGSPDGIVGLAWRGDSAPVVNEPRPPIEDLDDLPRPDRDLIDQKLYHAQSFLSYSGKAMTIYTSRGCPGRCVFCASGHRLRARIRERSIENVMTEIDYLRERFDMEYLLIKDDTFTLRRSRVEEFCDSISKRHPGLKWHCMVRVNTVDEPLLRRMRNAGLNDVFFGIESGNNDILKRARKGITTERARQAVGACARLGIRSYGAFILGLPGDNRQTIEETIRFACSLPLTMAGFSILTPYPGTQVYEEHFCLDPSEPIDYDQFVASTGLHYVRGYTGLDGMDMSELPDLVSQAQRRFYLRPSQILRILRHSTPSMALGCLKGFLALVQKEIYLRRHRRKGD